MIIEDGTGDGFSAEVNAEKRLVTSAVTSTESDHNADKGNKFNVNTGDITITDAVKFTALYIKNNSDDPIFITAVIYNLGTTASGSGDVKIDVIRNPTAGDIVTNANDCEMISNQNFGSSLTFTGDAFKGAEGETVVSDGEISISTRSASATGRIVVSLGALVLKKGSSIAINYTPPTGNTSQTVQFAVSSFFQDIVV